MHNYKDLDVWMVSRLICTDIYNVTSIFPSEEKFGLTNQLRRSVVSIPSNIAEGASRTSNKEFIRFLEIAMGSAYELETQLLISGDLGYISNNKVRELLIQLRRVIKMLSKLRSSFFNY